MTLRRQTALRDAWPERNPSARLDTSLTLVDAGVSGFKRQHRTNKKHALAMFLDLVERGRVPAGSFLIVENLDRLTRETPVDAIPAVLGLIKAGVTVVQLAPTEVPHNTGTDQGRLRMMWEPSGGKSERKRQMVSAEWKARMVSATALQKVAGAKWCSFPLDVFTKSVLRELAELKAAELFTDTERVRGLHEPEGQAAETALREALRRLAIRRRGGQARCQAQRARGLRVHGRGYLTASEPAPKKPKGKGKK